MQLTIVTAVHVSTYIASHVHIIRRLSIRPDHTIGSKVSLHARRLPCKDNGAILGRGCEVGPGYG